MINIKRASTIYRPWSTSKGYIEKIVIYNESESVVINQGWIDSIEEEGLFFNELPFKRKVDLTKKLNFLAKSEKWNGTECLTLFVYAKDLKTEVKFSHFDFSESKEFFKYCEFKNNDRLVKFKVYDHCEKSELMLKAEKISENLKDKTFLKLSSYDIVEILKIYNIEEKKNDNL